MRVRIISGFWPKSLEEIAGPGTPFDNGNGFFGYTELNGYSAVSLDEIAKMAEAVQNEPSVIQCSEHEGVAFELVRPGDQPNALLPVDNLNWTVCFTVIDFGDVDEP